MKKLYVLIICIILSLSILPQKGTAATKDDFSDGYCSFFLEGKKYRINKSYSQSSGGSYSIFCGYTNEINYEALIVVYIDKNFRFDGMDIDPDGSASMYSLYPLGVNTRAQIGFVDNARVITSGSIYNAVINIYNKSALGLFNINYYYLGNCVTDTKFLSIAGGKYGIDENIMPYNFTQKAGIFVFDNVTGQPVVNAKVSIPFIGYTGYSDDLGIVVLPKNTEGMFNVIVEKSEYNTTSNKLMVLKLGAIQSIAMSTISPTKLPYISTADITVNDKTTSLIQGSNVKIKESDTNTFLIKIKGIDPNSSDQSLSQIQRYEIWQNKKFLKSSADGNFSMSGVDFEIGTNITACAVSTDERRGKYQALNIQVLDDWTYSSSEDIGAKLGDELEFTIPNTIPIIGGTNISMDYLDIPIYILEGIDEKGESYREIGINIENDLTKDEKKTLIDFLNSNDTIRSGLSKLEKIQKAKKPSFKVLPGAFDMDVNIVGYIKTDGENYNISSGTIKASLEGEFAKGIQASIGPVPIAIKVTLSSTGECVGEFRFVKNKDGSYSLLPYGEVTWKIIDILVDAGVGIVDFASVGGYANGAITYYILTSRVDTFIQGGFYANFLSFRYEWPIARKDWSYSSKSTKAQMTFADTPQTDMYNIAAYKPTPRDYLSAQSPWMGNDGPSPIHSNGVQSSENQQYTNKEIRILQESVYPQMGPMVVQAGEQIIMFFLADDGTRELMDRSVLMYSLYDKSQDSWGFPQKVWDDGTADFMPAIYSIDDTVYVTWQNLNKQFGEDATLEDFSAASEIGIAQFDLQSGTFLNAENLTSNEHMDTRPCIYADGESAIAIWVSNEANDVFGLNSENSLMMSALDNLEWSTPRSIASSLNSITALDLGHLGDSVSVAFITDAGNDLNTVDDRKLNVQSLDGTVLFTVEQGLVSSPVFTKIGSSVAFTWFQNNDIQYVNDWRDSPQALFGDGRLSTDRYKILNSAGETSVLFIDRDTSEEKANVFGYLYRNGIWSENVNITDIDRTIMNMDVIINTDGSYLFGFVGGELSIDEQGVVTENCDLCTMKVAPSYDLELEDVSYIESDVKPGIELPLTLRVFNNGELPTEEIIVKVTNNGSELSNVLMPLPLAPGEDKNIEVSLQLPEQLPQNACYEIAVATPDEIYNVEDNAKQITVGHADLSMDPIKVTQLDGVYTVTTDIYNIGLYPVGGMLELMASEDSETILGQTKIPLLQPGESYSVVYRINPAEMRITEAGQTMLLKLTADQEEGALADNTAFFSLFDNLPENYNIVLIDDPVLPVEAYAGRYMNVSASVSAYNTIESARLWYTGDGAIVQSIEMSVLDDGCTWSARVKVPQGITELQVYVTARDTADNEGQSTISTIPVLQRDIVFGDVDLDGSITLQDALMICNYKVGRIPLTDDQLIAADVDSVDGVTLQDALMICNYKVGRITTFPAAG